MGITVKSEQQNSFMVCILRAIKLVQFLRSSPPLLPHRISGGNASFINNIFLASGSKLRVTRRKYPFFTPVLRQMFSTHFVGINLAVNVFPKVYVCIHKHF